MAPHINFWIVARGINIGLSTRMYFSDEEAANRADPVLNLIEHVGLAGRYGSPDDADGDLHAMAKMAGLLKPGGDMVLSIPIGRDAVYAPWHRVYGEQRLPQLLERWNVAEESY